MYSTKLPEYKHLDSLQQMIFVNQNKVTISSYIRLDKANTWLNQDFYSLEDEILIDNQPVAVGQFIEKLSFRPVMSSKSKAQKSSNLLGFA